MSRAAAARRDKGKSLAADHVLRRKAVASNPPVFKQIAYAIAYLVWKRSLEFDGFDWDDGNRAKCRKHGLALDLIEAVFARPVLILPDRQKPQGEPRFRAIGTAEFGRKVFVAFTFRGTAIRPISARYMHQQEIDLYEKTYPGLPDG